MGDVPLGPGAEEEVRLETERLRRAVAGAVVRKGLPEWEASYVGHLRPANRVRRRDLILAVAIERDGKALDRRHAPGQCDVEALECRSKRHRASLQAGD